MKTGNFEMIKSFQTSSGVYSLAVLSNGDFASAGDGVIEIWNGVRHEFNLRTQLKEGLNGRILSLNVLTNGRLVSGGEDKALKICFVFDLLRNLIQILFGDFFLFFCLVN